MSPRYLAAHLLPAPAVALAVLAACASPTATQGPSPDSSPSTAPSPPASEAPSAMPDGDAGVIVTFLVAGEEEYRIRLTDPEDIEIGRRLLAGEEAPRIPNGEVVRDGPAGVNEPWSWHIDPDTVEFADMTIEVCDGRPSDVEAGTITSDRFCPWSAEVIDIEE